MCSKSHYLGFNSLVLGVILDWWFFMSITFYLQQMSRNMTKPTYVTVRPASAQFDQSLHCGLNRLLRTQAFFMRTTKTLIRLGGCPGWSESSLGTKPHCWFCHVAAQMKSCITYANMFSVSIYSPKVLVNFPGSDGSVPTWLKNCWLGR